MLEIENYIARNTQADVSDFKRYFKLVYRGTYYSAMKVHAAKLLKSEKYTVEKIGEILSNNHSNIVHLLNKRKDNPEIDELIAENFNDWILSGLYPVTSQIKEWNGKEKETISYISYSLVKK